MYKTNPEAVNENKYSPLILACYRGNNGVVWFLIGNVKYINYNIWVKKLK